jgi:hypothetical protein
MEIRMMKHKVYAILYQVRKTGQFRSICKLWFTTIPSVLSKSESTLTLRERQFYGGIIHNSGKSGVDLVPNIWGAVYDIAQGVVNAST